MAKSKRTKKQLIQFVTQYGIHIWAILIIANAALVYAYNFETHAATKSDLPIHALDVSQAPSPSPSGAATSVSPSQVEPSPSPSTGPLGPVISLTFTVPGIGSGGGVLKPLHPKRDVTIYLFSPDVNSRDPTVKPLYTIQTTAMFDSNPYSPTYTSYLNPFIDLGSDVKDGNYQIAFRTNLSLRTLIKQNPSDLGGEIVGLSKDGGTFVIPSQTVLMGDVVPDQGDNTINASDYNAFINCYGAKNNTAAFCKGHNYGDFNDDGVIDGIDYNILLRSLYALSQEGFPIPTISLSPSPSAPVHVTKPKKVATPTPHKQIKKTATPSAKTTTTKSTGGGFALGGILFIFFLLILGGAGVFLYFKNETIRDKINAFIHLSPTGEPSASESQESTSEQPEPVESETKETPAPKANKPEASAQPIPPKQTPGGSIEKDCYVKKKGPDEKGTGVWLTLTDDNGPVEAHYAKTDVVDGFAKVKGSMKTENGKTFLEISELNAED